MLTPIYSRELGDIKPSLDTRDSMWDWFYEIGDWLVSIRCIDYYLFENVDYKYSPYIYKNY